ncbi:unnamed protein product [Arctia plantaginis]|uniref:ARM repeat superfamily protein n=1 Tax=Arctia plantaginis TaxID=874455 RepID=A0A8S0YX51_ARCPL|nr:unnamed protein product [Arctia plantaginis]
MESWSELVSSYPDNPEPRDIEKALRTAETLISGNLAPFDIEWLAQTLLFKPIDVLNTIATKKSEEWLKNIAESFKVISRLVCKYWEVLEKDHETIVKLCMLPYDAQTKKAAIHCLIDILKNPGVDPGNAKRHIDALESSSTCKAPLAVLVGNICRYCPEGVDQEYIRVWRIYLNMLQQQNNTDTIVKAVLEGIDGLFENFGRDLPIMEVNNFYKDFSRKCARLSKCIEPLLSILKSHAGLFKEKLAEDDVLRLYLWGLNSLQVKDALLAVYTVIFDQVSEDKIKTIISKEIQPRMDSESSLVKHTALRIAFCAKNDYKIPVPNIFRPDALEFQIRHRSISHQEADLVSLCIGSRESYVKSLLLTIIMYYDNIPVSLRQGIVVKGILETSKDVRKVALTLLIELSRQNGGLEKFADVWRALLDPDTKEKCVLEEILQQIVVLLKAFLDASKKDPDQVLSLSGVLSFVLSVSETDNSSQHCESLRPVINELSNVLCIPPSSLLSSKFVYVEMFKENSLLKQLLSTFKNDKRDDNLSLLQEIFSNNTVETKLLTKALSEMDTLLKSKQDLESRQVCNIMNQILKLKSKRSVSTTDDRILQRDLSLLIGEHRHLIPKEDFTDDLYSLEMDNKIIISLPNIVDGKNYKIDLLRILQISLLHEDHETLYCLLTIITVNLRDRPEPCLQYLTWRVIHSMFRCSDVVDVTSALRMCATAACAQQAIHSITTEVNPAVRRMLCDSLEVILLQDPGSETSGELLTMVADQLMVMINSPEQSNYEAGLDITRIFLNALRENDSMSINYLPNIITLLSKKIVNDVYKSATDIFMEKIDIFDNDQEILSGIVGNMLMNNNKTDIEYILEFLKKVFGIKNYDGSLLVEMIFNDSLDDVMRDVLTADLEEKFVNVLQVLALAKHDFDIKGSILKTFITKDALTKVMNILSVNASVAIQQNICKFLNEYSLILLEVDKEKTLKCLTNLIENLQPESLPTIKNDISACLCTYKNILKVLPPEINMSYDNWCKKLNLETVTEELNKIINMADIFGTLDVSDEICQKIQALNILADVFDHPISYSRVWMDILLEKENHIRHVIASDMLSIAEKCLSCSEFEDVLEKNEDFVLKYLRVYFERILCAVWPNFEQLDFEVKLSVASELLRLPRSVGLISPVRWMMSAITSPDTRLDHKLRMITILPGGSEYSSCYRSMAGTLPIHLSEMGGDHAGVLRALLDSLATTGDLTLLDIIITLAAADDTKGWWDDAIDASMSSVADRRDENIYDAAYQTMKKRPGLGGCRRVFLPLLKHSTRIFCEDYASKIIPDLLSTLKTGFKEPTNTEVFRERVLSYAKAFSILQMIIEKVPSKYLESGVINAKAGSQDPWYVIKEVCIYSMTLRTKVRCPDNASAALQDACLRLQTSAYNCLTAAICKRRPSQKQYAAVFDMSAWTKIVDPHVQHDLWPRAYWGDTKSRKQPGGADGQGPNSVSTTLTYSRTVRTSLFMATLSENPMQYDMIPNEDEEEDNDVEEEKPVGYENHPLNAHGCLVSITALLEHSSTLEHTDWLTKLAEGLTSNLPVNAKWTLAQAICNARTELKPHASVLTPALLDLVATTPKVIGDRQVLNNLHVDILWTVIKWDIKVLPHYNSMSLCAKYLISTCIEHRSQEGVSRSLLNTLNNVLLIYGSCMNIDWDELQKHINEMPKTAPYLYPILQRILKNGILIPELLNKILAKFEVNDWMKSSKLPEVFGLALSLETNKEEFLPKFWQILANVKSTKVTDYVRVLKYAQRADPKCCNRQNFRIITDLASKVERAGCLSIISVYLENCVEESSCTEVFEIIGLKELLDGENKIIIEALKVAHNGLKFMNSEMKKDILNAVSINCRNSSVSVRKQAFAVILKIFQDLVIVKTDYSAKRRALQSTPILDTLGSTGFHEIIVKEVSQGVFDGSEEIANMMRDGVETCLSKDMAVRFAELFYLIFYLARKDRKELSHCGYILLDLLFRDLKRQDGYTDVKLSDQPLAPSDNNIGYITYATIGRTFGQKQLGSARREIDVQMSVADIFEIFVQSSKVNSQICKELCLKLMKCLQLQGSGPRFGLDSVMAKLLTDMLKEEPNCVTPLVLEASRIFLDSINLVDGLKDSLKIVKRKVLNAEALAYYDIIIEDLILRSDGRDFFNFSIKETGDVEMKDENLQFSIEGLTEVFGYLSNWEDLRIQDRECIEGLLPPLMVEREQFKTYLGEYFEAKQKNIDYKLWFNKMAGSYVSSKLGKTILQFKQNWLRDMERWPVRDFVVSAVIEGIKWPADDTLMTCDIKASDCLAEWAARLMIRSAYFDGDERKSMMCRGDELKWCSEANERQLPKLALQCIERNKGSLFVNEALPWFYENVRARRLVALRENDTSKLQKALQATEREDKDVSFGLKHLILQLRKDLGVLSKSKLDEILLSLNNITEDHSSFYSNKNGVDLITLYEFAMDHYDELWELSDTSTQAEIISDMATLLGNITDGNLTKDSNLRISILFNRLVSFEGLLSEETSRKLLEKIMFILPSLDTYSIDQLKNVSNAFPTSIWKSYKIDKEESFGLCKEYLQLVCDPSYTLARYCAELSKDWTQYPAIFAKISNKFDSSFRGTDYISLNTIKKKLFALENADTREREKQLKTITTELFKKLTKPVLRLSQLSPELAKDTTLEEQRENLRKLLALPSSVHVVKFSQQVQVFVDSIRRPCVLSALLSNGTTKKYIIKSGEVLANDASVQRAIAGLPELFQGQVRSYNVTTLSEDCAVIEYLDNYQRLQEFMGDKVRIPVVRLDNDKLVLSPSLALEQYNALCNKIPVYTLRSSIEDKCSSLEEFIAKKRMFLDTLSTMTITNWLFGVGDRHLQNIMINKQDGGVCGVDLASVFEYGLREFVPARLTANLLAVCDVKVLESRLQRMLLCLRQSRRIYEAFVGVSFYWKGRDFSEIKHIRNILQGTMTSYQVTRDVIENSKIKHKQEYLNILDSVFQNFTCKQTYSVEEQVSCLLQHCTDPKILSITPQGWEAWI